MFIFPYIDVIILSSAAYASSLSYVMKIQTNIKTRQMLILLGDLRKAIKGVKPDVWIKTMRMNSKIVEIKLPVFTFRLVIVFLITSSNCNCYWWAHACKSFDSCFGILAFCEFLPLICCFSHFSFFLSFLFLFLFSYLFLFYFIVSNLRRPTYLDHGKLETAMKGLKDWEVKEQKVKSHSCYFEYSKFVYVHFGTDVRTICSSIAFINLFLLFND